MKTKREQASDKKHALVLSAVLLTPEQKERLRGVLKKIFHQDVEIENRIDKSVLAGFLVRIGDWFLNATVKNELSRLKQSL